MHPRLHPRPRLHPATVLTAAGCLWLIVVIANTPVISAAVIALCMLLTPRIVPLLAALGLPACLSMLLVHAPYGSLPVTEPFAIPLLTVDGIRLAGELALRFGALMACMLAAGARTDIVEIAKWLQTTRVGYKVAYIVGSTLQYIPAGQAAVRAVRDANALAGRRITVVNMVHTLVIPVIARLLITGAQRGQALSAIGFDVPGPRTIMRPVADSRAQRIIRWLLPLTVVGALWI